MTFPQCFSYNFHHNWFIINVTKFFSSQTSELLLFLVETFPISVTLKMACVVLFYWHWCVLITIISVFGTYSCLSLDKLKQIKWNIQSLPYTFRHIKIMMFFVLTVWHLKGQQRNKLYFSIQRELNAMSWNPWKSWVCW